MSDLYAVFGNPIAHSKSPAIHARFAADTSEDLIYEARLAPVDGFARAIDQFVADGGKGANVTVPFKEEAFRLVTSLSPRASQAGAVNTLIISEHGIRGDNTDGAGLVRDMTENLGVSLAGKQILLLGAGGAARGVVAPLLAAGPSGLFIANRSVERAAALARAFQDLAEIETGDFSQTAGRRFDIVINATSSSLSGQALPLPAGVFAPESWAYDMMYGQCDTPFMVLARQLGAAHVSDGLGMLVEQAAEAFWVWRGVRPSTARVLADLRDALQS